MKCGGIAEALRMIAVARAHGMKVMLGCMIESSIAITAAAHLSPLVDTADLDGNLLLESDPYVGATVRGGKDRAAGRPGARGQAAGVIRGRPQSKAAPRSGGALRGGFQGGLAQRPSRMVRECPALTK